MVEEAEATDEFGLVAVRVTGWVGAAPALWDVQLAAATAELLGHFTARRFARCLESAEAVEALGGGPKLVRAYRLLATKYLEELPGLEFDGRIVVDELPHSL